MADPPSPHEPPLPDFDTGLRLEEIDPARPRPFDTPWGSFATYVVAGEVVAAQSFCPHLDGPLFQGTFSGPGRREVTCPWHGWRFSLHSGACLASPRGEGADARILFLAASIDARGHLRLSGPPRSAPPPGPRVG